MCAPGASVSLAFSYNGGSGFVSSCKTVSMLPLMRLCTFHVFMCTFVPLTSTTQRSSFGRLGDMMTFMSIAYLLSFYVPCRGRVSTRYGAQ